MNQSSESYIRYEVKGSSRWMGLMTFLRLDFPWLTVPALPASHLKFYFTSEGDKYILADWDRFQHLLEDVQVRRVESKRISDRNIIYADSLQVAIQRKRQ